MRKVVSGQRVPMELTSLGRAYLASAAPQHRSVLLALFRQRRGAQWPVLQKEIEEAMAQVQARGYCAASWQPEVVALAAPLRYSSMPLVLNVSISSGEPLQRIERQLAPFLLGALERVEQELRRRG